MSHAIRSTRRGPFKRRIPEARASGLLCEEDPGEPSERFVPRQETKLQATGKHVPQRVDERKGSSTSPPSVSEHGRLEEILIRGLLARGQESLEVAPRNRFAVLSQVDDEEFRQVPSGGDEPLGRIPEELPPPQELDEGVRVKVVPHRLLSPLATQLLLVLLRGLPPPHRPAKIREIVGTGRRLDGDFDALARFQALPEHLLAGNHDA